MNQLVRYVSDFFFTSLKQSILSFEKFDPSTYTIEYCIIVRIVSEYRGGNLCFSSRVMAAPIKRKKRSLCTYCCYGKVIKTRKPIEPINNSSPIGSTALLRPGRLDVLGYLSIVVVRNRFYPYTMFFLRNSTGLKPLLSVRIPMCSVCKRRNSFPDSRIPGSFA